MHAYLHELNQNRTELERVNNKFASLLLRFLSHFMQASLYDIRFVVNKGDRSVRCFSQGRQGPGRVRMLIQPLVYKGNYTTSSAIWN